MAVNPQHELVWQGRLHLGDEPGAYGDADYSGLAAEIPITVHRLDASQIDPTTFRLILESEALQTFAGFPGHAITIVIYEPDPNQQFHFLERVLANERFTGSDNNHKEVVLDIGNAPGPNGTGISSKLPWRNGFGSGRGVFA